MSETRDLGPLFKQEQGAASCIEQVNSAFRDRGNYDWLWVSCNLNFQTYEYLPRPCHKIAKGVWDTKGHIQNPSKARLHAYPIQSKIPIQRN